MLRSITELRSTLKTYKQIDIENIESLLINAMYARDRYFDLAAEPFIKSILDEAEYKYEFVKGDWFWRGDAYRVWLDV